MAIVVLGAGGGLGRAITQELKKQFPEQRIMALSRQAVEPCNSGQITYCQIADYDENSLNDWVSDFKQSDEKLTGVISTIGMLHDDETFPEKKLSDITADNLTKLFSVNAVKPLLILKSFLPILDRKNTHFWVQLSAKVGSIEDNYLGGWYAYRSSKAALNMLLKTASIELKRTHKSLAVAAIHPGTTDTRLSAPFQERISADKLYSPELSAERIVAVVKNLKPEQSGNLWHWDGSRLPF
ncbi:SDR family NAD(P)-dependent oxidoreductase [Idiomarina aminovorans]|uniref:SDR family NAD(P)-dependent oxidoreductase n=1 Tax=Idiomarina aminovorans TaxID=2914829 RepID=UPI002005E648|nr:SDR family NAD(P)-dependent oxidoreductase [Idiomarina sp. ATCH4]MCK7459800.1 SDR family NAD(P)-dependent oxidoreductase [Idiomarina sp. ATCH4]